MFGTKQISKAKNAVKKAAQKAPTPKKPPAPKKVAKAIKKAVPTKAPAKAAKAAGSQLRKAVPKKAVGTRMGGAGYRKFEGDALWLPNTNRPEWLDGSLPGDRGFDPLGLAKPTEYLQIDVDELDQNAAVNKAGEIVGAFTQRKDKVSAKDALSPYDEVFGIERFRECELIHGRWAMMACLGCIWAELQTGVSWVDAGKVELDGAQYFNLSLPFTITQLCWIEAILVGGAEIYRNRELDPERRCYPGGVFDPLKLASDDSDKSRRLKEAELKHGRLAMIAFLGYGVQALATGQGVLGSLALFSKNLTNAAPALEDAVEAVESLAQ